METNQTMKLSKVNEVMSMLPPKDIKTKNSKNKPAKLVEVNFQ